jgi:hypothetical protein
VTTGDGTDPAIDGQGSTTSTTDAARQLWTSTAGTDLDDDGRAESGFLAANGSYTETGGCGAFGDTEANQDNSSVAPDAGGGKFPAGAAGMSWDNDGDGSRDGAECALGTDPNSSASAPTAAACGGTGDGDMDGLPARAETCRWGTSDGSTDSDGDTVSDCVEANDNNGDLASNFPGDTINNAKAAFNINEQTKNYDLNGDNAVNFPGDSILSAKMSFNIAPIVC